MTIKQSTFNIITTYEVKSREAIERALQKGKCIQEWTKQNLWKTAFKKFDMIGLFKETIFKGVFSQYRCFKMLKDFCYGPK